MLKRLIKNRKAYRGELKARCTAYFGLCVVLSGIEDRLNNIRDEFKIVRTEEWRAIGILNIFPSFAQKPFKDGFLVACVEYVPEFIIYAFRLSVRQMDWLHQASSIVSCFFPQQF